ncbi:MAG: HK97 family phage prohead protease [Planctomycetaceae bacterium]|nr:HK97 family phage prohead protease [Planctomycetaceae bacterium]
MLAAKYSRRSKVDPNGGILTIIPKECGDSMLSPCAPARPNLLGDSTALSKQVRLIHWLKPHYHLPRLDIPAQIATSDGITSITGLAAVFYDGTLGTEYSITDATGSDAVERILSTAFDNALSQGYDVPALLNHDRNVLLGRTSAGTLTLEKNARGLKYAIRFDGSDPDHQKVASKIKKGDLSGSSFGFVPEDIEWCEESGIAVCYVRSVKLLDVSPVFFPAYASTSVSLRSAS